MRLSSARIDFGLSGVDADPGAAAGGGHGDHVEAAALARHHGWQPSRIGFGRRMRVQELAARPAVEQLDAAFDRFRAVLGVDRARIGPVHEGQFARIVARPDGGGHGFDQRAQSGAVVDVLLVALGELGKLVFDATHLAQPQDRPSAGNLALGFDDAAGERGHRHREAHPPRAQGVEGTLHVAGGVRFEPGAEGEHGLGRVGGGHQRRIADDFRLVGGRSPGHEDLRLREEERVGTIDSGLGCESFVARRSLDLGQPCARAHEQHGGNNGKAENAERERKRGDLGTIERRQRRGMGIEIRDPAGRLGGVTGIGRQQCR